MDTISIPTCPRCDAAIENPRFMAISRHDNSTRVCSTCGADEALLQFAGFEVWSTFPEVLAICP